MRVCVCLKGFWAELHWNTERANYLDTVPNPRYKPAHIQADWDKQVTLLT